MTTLTLNRRLATLLGWTNIVEIGGALLGTPPPGEYCVRNQCLVPDWAGDWRDCGPLIAKFRIAVEFDQERVEDACAYALIGVFRNDSGRFAELLDGDHNADHHDAARRAVVRAAIAKLEMGR